MFYSAFKNSFFSPEIHGDSIPSDAIEISDALYKELFEAQSNGKQIKPGEDGSPVAVDPTYSVKEITESLKQQRQAAFNKEADPLFFQYQAGEIDKDDWTAKREEIRQRFPYPTE